MLKLSLWRRMAIILLALVVSACGGGGGSASPPTGGITVTPGNGQAIITWTADPGVKYWLVYAATAGSLDVNNLPSGHLWAAPTDGITSPYVVSGLVNGVTYAFAANGRTGTGKGGALTATQWGVPKYAGTSWVAANATATLGTADMRGVAYGTASDLTINYLAVGSSGAIYKGLEGVSQSLNGMAWTKLSTGPTVDFKAATYAFGKYIAIGANGGANNIVSSADFTTWTPAALTTGTAALNTGINALAASSTTLVAVGDSGTTYYTTDGLTWARGTTPAGFTSHLNGVAYSSYTGMWIAVGAGGALLTSVDAINWTLGNSGVTDNLNGVTATTGNLLVAVGDNGIVITNSTMTTAAAGTWASQALGTSLNNLYAVSTDSVQLLAVGQAGKVYTSLNGTSWTPIAQTSATTDLMAIVGSTYKYLVVGKTGAGISSIN